MYMTGQVTTRSGWQDRLQAHVKAALRPAGIRTRPHTSRPADRHYDDKRNDQPQDSPSNTYTDTLAETIHCDKRTMGRR